MAGKRSATSELNHENWDQDDEPEDSGTFQRANEQTLQRRVIKTAKRRNLTPANDTDKPEEKKNVFSGFSGFKTNSAPTPNAFGFLSNLTNNTKYSNDNVPKTNGNATDEPSSSANSLKPTVTTHKNGNSEKKTDSDKKSDEYYGKLKGLNESVLKWIKRHVEENPLINLQPIFKDYEKYFTELDKASNENKTTTNSIKLSETNQLNSSTPMFNFGTPVVSKSTPVENSTPVTPSFSFGSNNKKATENSTAVVTSTPSFSFGSNSKKDITENSTTAAPSFSFEGKNKNATGDPPKFSFGSPAGTKSSEKPAPSFSFGSVASGDTSKSSSGSGFTFGSQGTTLTNTTGSIPSFGDTKGFSSDSKPFAFANVSKPTVTEDSNQAAKDDANEDEPPKVEFTPVVESDHLYTVRCKVFVKKDNAFGDRGVGNLFVKNIENSEKKQLIVRADTNLGNLLCNFILSESIPMQRMGKKDVMLVCIATPDSKPPPVPMLLRVKSPEEADKLLETLEKYKK